MPSASSKEATKIALPVPTGTLQKDQHANGKDPATETPTPSDTPTKGQSSNGKTQLNTGTIGRKKKKGGKGSGSGGQGPAHPPLPVLAPAPAQPGPSTPQKEPTRNDNNDPKADLAPGGQGPAPRDRPVQTLVVADDGPSTPQKGPENNHTNGSGASAKLKGKERATEYEPATTLVEIQDRPSRPENELGQRQDYGYGSGIPPINQPIKELGTPKRSGTFKLLDKNEFGPYEPPPNVNPAYKGLPTWRPSDSNGESSNTGGNLDGKDASSSGSNGERKITPINVLDPATNSSKLPQADGANESPSAANGEAAAPQNPPPLTGDGLNAKLDQILSLLHELAEKVNDMQQRTSRVPNTAEDEQRTEAPDAANNAAPNVHEVLKVRPEDNQEPAQAPNHVKIEKPDDNKPPGDDGEQVGEPGGQSAGDASEEILNTPEKLKGGTGTVQNIQGGIGPVKGLAISVILILPLLLIVASGRLYDAAYSMYNYALLQKD